MHIRIQIFPNYAEVLRCLLRYFESSDPLQFYGCAR